MSYSHITSGKNIPANEDMNAMLKIRFPLLGTMYLLTIQQKSILIYIYITKPVITMAKSRLLIVEDSKVTAKIINDILLEQGYDIIDIVQSGEEAIKSLKKSVPDLILMDIILKGKLDGIDTVSIINEDFDIPVIFLTSVKTDTYLDRIKKTESFGYLTKPFKKFDLLLSIETSINRANLEKKMLSNEKKLRDAHSEINSLLSSLVTILIGVDKNDILTHWNKISEKTFGISASAVINKPFMQSGINWEWDKIYEGISISISEDRAVKLKEVKFVYSDKKQGFLNIYINPIKNDKNSFVGFLLSGEDITEIRAMSIQLHQAQKLESIGQLASGIAHEINTPIQYINDNAYFLNDACEDVKKIIKESMKLIKKYDNNEDISGTIMEMKETIKKNDIEYLTKEIPAAIDQTIEGISRVASIVKSMKNFAHPAVNKKTLIDLAKSINDTITISRNEWKYVADIKTDFDPKITLIPLYSNEFNQVILNLILNAAYAIAEKTGKNPDKKGKITFSTHLKKDSVEIKIADTGTGIPENVLENIFDPFFTTKKVGEGTGQGLTISYDIITQKHNGTITCESKLNDGSVFIITLPLDSKNQE